MINGRLIEVSKPWSVSWHFESDGHRSSPVLSGGAWSDGWRLLTKDGPVHFVTKGEMAAAGRALLTRDGYRVEARP